MTEQIEVLEEATEESTVLYVIQRQTNLSGEDAGDVVWEDVERVRAQPRSRRKTILQKWLEVEQVAGSYRVLDADSAHEMRVAPKEQPPKWEIS